MNALKWIFENKEWLFSGIGVVIIAPIIRMVLRKNKKKSQQINIKQMNKAENSTLIGIQFVHSNDGSKDKEGNSNNS